MGADQHWELLPAQAVMTLRVGALVNGWQAFPTFPAWLGKNSTMGKLKRMTNELVHHTLLQVGQGFQPIRLEYIPYMRTRLLNTVINQENGAEQAIAMLNSYGLSRDDFMENMRELQFLTSKKGESERPGPLVHKDGYEAIDTKTKTAFTRLYNAGSHVSQALVSNQAVTKGKKKGVDLQAESGSIEDMSAAAAVEDENSDDEIDMSKFAAKKKAAPKKKTVTKKK